MFEKLFQFQEKQPCSNNQDNKSEFIFIKWKEAIFDLFKKFQLKRFYREMITE